MPNSGDEAHLLAFPHPAQGHMLPMLDLIHQLALHGLTITIVITPKNLPTLNPLLSQHPSSIQTLVLPFPSHPALPPGVENVRDIGNHGNIPIINALSKLHDPIATWFGSHLSPPVAILSDFFLGWTLNLANRLRIPRVTFYSSGAFLTSISNYCWLNVESVHSMPVVTFTDLPRSPSFTREQLPSIFRHYKKTDPDWELVRDGMRANTKSWGCVFNTFEALEGAYLDHLRRNLDNPRIWGVGPLGLMGGAEKAERLNPDPRTAARVMTWLEECPDASVVYLCFGSQKQLKRPQMEALAAGLEKSGIRFVWVVKFFDGNDDILDGFEDRTKHRGLIVSGWVPQVEILGHRAVTGFLSHCGWNSVTEGIVAGVMMLTWPMEADQYVNAKLLSEDMGMGVRVWEGEDSVPDSDKLAKVFSEAVGGHKAERIRAAEMKEKALGAVKPGGSSWRELDGLVKELNKL